ncbi:hypothetical protein ACFYUD_05485 [Nocardia tengchongensis]|uniref:hypothetical protein n=1 Tax=Nocardia tengchongensis TaxID=2055889 RepID=UPI003692F12A
MATLIGQVATGRWATIIPSTWLRTMQPPADARVLPLEHPSIRAAVAMVTRAGEPVSVLTRAHRRGVGSILATTHARPFTLVIVETVFAALASLVADRAGLRPAGPFFGLFALGAVAAIPPSTGTPDTVAQFRVRTARFAR